MYSYLADSEFASEAHVPAALARSSAARSLPSAAPQCADMASQTFTDENGAKRDCAWLADQIRTEHGNAESARTTFCTPPPGYRTPLAAVICPATCGVPCPSLEDKCRDTSAIVGNVALSKKRKKCSWIAKRGRRLAKYCSRGEAGVRTRADAACPKTCGKCGQGMSASVCPALPHSSHDEDDVLTIRREGRPDRRFRIYTPGGLDPARPARVVFVHHGWTTGTYCQGRIFLGGGWRDVADEHGYVLVAVDGLAENNSDAPRSYTFPGSADGLGRDGVTATTCNGGYGPDYCYPSCEERGRCGNRCGWTHCLDDDVQLFVDLVEEVAEKYVCLDRRRVYVYGYSMGGMFAWSLAQDPRSAPLIAGIGAAQGLPMHDHLVGKGDSSSIPAIGIYGDDDCSVPPGDGTSVFTESCQEGYHYVDAFHQHRMWAQEHGCTVGDTHPARFEYRIEGRDEVECASHCDPTAGPPMSVDCRSDDEHGKEPWHLDIALKFFEHHWAALQQS